MNRTNEQTSREEKRQSRQKKCAQRQKKCVCTEVGENRSSVHNPFAFWVWMADTCVLTSESNNEHSPVDHEELFLCELPLFAFAHSRLALFNIVSRLIRSRYHTIHSKYMSSIMLHESVAVCSFSIMERLTSGVSTNTACLCWFVCRVRLCRFCVVYPTFFLFEHSRLLVHLYVCLFCLLLLVAYRLLIVHPQHACVIHEYYCIEPRMLI